MAKSLNDLNDEGLEMFYKGLEIIMAEPEHPKYQRLHEILGSEESNVVRISMVEELLNEPGDGKEVLHG